MRIAINLVSSIGVRVGKILTAESELVALGVYGESKGLGQDRRIIPTSTLQGFDALVTDDAETGSALAGLAVEDGLACALPAPAAEAVISQFQRASRPLLMNCSLSGLAATLAAHEAARTDSPLDTVIAWTSPGKPLRRGTPVAFPDPVGARWGRRVGPVGDTTYVEVPVDSRWAGATATIVGSVSSGSTARIVGVADDSDHLEAIALAAGAVVAATTRQTGVLEPADVADEFLSAALKMGLGVATYTLDRGP